VIPRSVLCPTFDQPSHGNKRQVDGEHFLAAHSKIAHVGTVIQRHDDDGATGDIETESLIGYEFIHKTNEIVGRAKAIGHLPDQKKHTTSCGDGRVEIIVSYDKMTNADNKRMENKIAEHALWTHWQTTD